MDALPGFLIAALALASSPGQATLSLAAAGAAFGARRGIGYLVSIVVGMVAVMAIVASGMVGLLLAMPGVAPVVAVLASLYFLWLALRITTAPPLSEEGARGEPPAVAAGLLLSLVNPKGDVAMAALFSGFTLLPERLAADAALKLFVLTLVITAMNVAWLLAGAALTRCFRDPRGNRIINLAFALSPVGSVALAFVV